MADHRRQWRIILDGRTEIARIRAMTAEQAIVKAHRLRGAPIHRLAAEDLGNADAERRHRTEAAHAGHMEDQDGRWAAVPAAPEPPVPSAPARSYHERIAEWAVALGRPFTLAEAVAALGVPKAAVAHAAAYGHLVRIGYGQYEANRAEDYEPAAYALASRAQRKARAGTWNPKSGALKPGGLNERVLTYARRQVDLGHAEVRSADAAVTLGMTGRDVGRVFAYLVDRGEMVRLKPGVFRLATEGGRP